MRQLFLAILSTIAACAFAQVEQVDTVYNFGTIREVDGKVKARFRFVNRSTGDVTIEQVRATCGCTASRYTRQAIAPGDTTAIDVQYNPSGRPGEFHKRLTISFLPEREHFTIAVEGKVIGSESTMATRYPDMVAGLRLNHRTIIFGQLEKGMQRTLTLRGYNTTADTLSLQLTNVPRHITAQVVPQQVAPGDAFSVVAQYNTEQQEAWGLTTDTFTIVSTKGSRAERGTIEATAVVVDSIDANGFATAPVANVSHTKLDFGVVHRTDSTVARTFTITNSGDDPLILRSMASQSPAVTTTATATHLNKGQSATIEVVVCPSSIATQWLDIPIKVYTNAPASRCITVRCVGEIK